jgi:hypothetical protein
MVLQAYSKYRKNMQDLITDWTKVTEEDLADFMQLGYYEISNDKLDLDNIKKDYEKKVATITNRGASKPGTANTSALTEWNKGMRRDPSLFPKLDNLKDYIKWESNTLDVAASQNVREVFDKTYSPMPGSEEANLFEKKKQFVRAAFIGSWTLSEGVEILRDIQDPQKAFAELQSQALGSLTAKIEAASIKEELRGMKWGNSAFAGLTKEFVARIHKRISDHDALVEAPNRFSESQKREILRSCVESNDDLRGIWTLEEQLKLKDPAYAMTYRQYYTMLVAQARLYDSALNGGKPNQGKANRAIMYHSVGLVG